MLNFSQLLDILVVLTALEHDDGEAKALYFHWGMYLLSKRDKAIAVGVKIMDTRYGTMFATPQ